MGTMLNGIAYYGLNLASGAYPPSPDHSPLTSLLRDRATASGAHRHDAPLTTPSHPPSLLSRITHTTDATVCPCPCPCPPIPLLSLPPIPPHPCHAPVPVSPGRLHLPGVRRLHARRHARGRAVRAPRVLHPHPRLRRRGGGRPHPPACRGTSIPSTSVPWPCYRAQISHPHSLPLSVPSLLTPLVCVLLSPRVM